MPRKRKNAAPAATASKAPESPSVVASAKSPDKPRGALYGLCTDIVEPTYGGLAGWFSVVDCAGRAIRSVAAFYYLAVTHPVSFFIFSLRYNHLWYGGILGVAATLILWPAWPLAVLVYRIALKVKNHFCKKASFDDGNVFFVAPNNPLASMLWDFYKEFSVYTSLFIMCGNDKTAVAHSWYDEITQKDFWRGHLQQGGARIPMELARWEGDANGACTWAACAGADGGESEVVGDIVIKLADSYLGIGDSFLEAGKDGYDGTRAGVEEILREKYNDGRKGTLVLDWVRPADGQEVHSLDILTVAQPDGSVELASCLYWGKCADGKSTHSSKAGYVCDVDGERIMAPAAWYSAYFKNEMGDEDENSDVPFGCGHNLPGLRAVCDTALRCHANALREQPWLRMCGWDVLIAKKGPTFFEGNFAAHRIPRRVFLTWENTVHFLKTFKPVM